MSRSPKMKKARWPKANLLSRENVLESYNLANDVAWWPACSVGTRGCLFQFVIARQQPRSRTLGRVKIQGRTDRESLIA